MSICSWGDTPAYHGYPRATGDLDIWVQISDENATAIVSALRRFGFSAGSLSKSPFLQEQQIVRIGFPPSQIDLTTSVSGVDFVEANGRKVLDTMDGVPVRVISREDLKLNKAASGRPKDINDLAQLARRESKKP